MVLYYGDNDSALVVNRYLRSTAPLRHRCDSQAAWLQSDPDDAEVGDRTRKSPRRRTGRAFRIRALGLAEAGSERSMPRSGLRKAPRGVAD